MTNITKAAQDALAALDEIHAGKRHPQLALAVAQQLRAALQDKVGEFADFQSRCMFVARLEKMQANGDAWLTIPAVLALLNDCDMLASTELSAQPAPVVPDRDAITVNLLRHTSLTKAQARALIAHWLDGVVPDAALFKKADPVVPDDVARDAAWYRLIRDGGGWPAAFAAHDAPEPLRGPELDAMLAAQKQGR